MTGLDRTTVHQGRAAIKCEDRVVGELKEVMFIFEGEEVRKEKPGESCYGTCSGVLSDKSLINEFNTLERSSVSMDISVDGGSGESRVELTGVRFIDDIPPSGVMKDIEFYGFVVSES